MTRKEKTEIQEQFRFNELHLQYSIETKDKYLDKLSEHLKEIDSENNFEIAKTAIEKINEGNPSETFYQVMLETL